MKLEQKRTMALLLGLGVILLALSQVRCGVGLLAWIAPVPLLVFLRGTTGWRSRLVFMGVMCLAWSLAAAKFITPPFPKSLILLNGLSFGIANGGGYLIWDRLRRRVPPVLANLAFAATLISLEWLQYSFTPLASNGAAAYTQLENLPFLQTASLFGITGISLLMYWFAAVASQTVLERKIPWRQSVVVIGLIVAAHIYGAMRIGTPTEDKTVRVATVGTDFDWFGGPAPDNEERKKIEDSLFLRTEEAARAGARMIVWNEVSAIVKQEEEPRLLDRAQEVASDYKTHMVLSYLLLIQEEPFLVENKYTWIGPDGAVMDTYLKHKRVPGEPSRPGDGKARVLETGFGKASGLICYDFDFPQLGLDRARGGTQILFVPSSDTLGVDPFHTQIAAVRAIEGGFSVIRSTRMGLSAAIDPVGRMRGWLSSNETDERIMMASIPTSGRWTLYAVVGDLLAYVSMVFVVLIIGVNVRSRFAKKKKTAPAQSPEVSD